MQTVHIHFDSKTYLFQQALAASQSATGKQALAEDQQLPDFSRTFYWNAKGKAIFYSSLPAQARYKLLQVLVQQGQHVLSLNTNIQQWGELAHYAKRGIGIRQYNSASGMSYKNYVDQNTRVIYLATIGDDLSVPDFQKVIRFAHDRGILVVVDNTAGAEGILFDPISWGADYVISNQLYWHPTARTKGHVVVRSSSLVIGEPWGKRSPYTAAATKGNHTLLASASLLRDSRNDADRIKEKLSATLQLAKWLQAAPQTEEVVYPGLPSHPDYFNTLKFFRNGFGNQLRWKVKGDAQAFDLLQKQFLGVPVPGVKITPAADRTSFKIEVRNANARLVTEALKRAFAVLRAVSEAQEELAPYAQQLRSETEAETTKKLSTGIL